MTINERKIFDGPVPFDTARKFLRQVRRATVWFSGTAFLPSTTADLEYPMPTNVEITVKEALKLVDDWRGFSERKEAAGKNGLVGVPMRATAWDSCGKTRHHIFIG
jgi:hypothetical protein